MTTTTSPTKRLTQAEKDLALQLAAGLGVHTIAAKKCLASSTVRSRVKALRSKLGCPGAPLHVLVHAILSAGHAPNPIAPRPAPDVSSEQAKLWRALASHKLALDIAHAAGIAPADLKEQTDQLLTAVGTTDLTQLVILGHAWGTLRSDHATRSGASL
ncbi:helix-turn-helix domain-containing protein [Streptomyces misionensis]|uniref:DNA-binding protein n=1 Tax=Streptomyces misionensis TaxID=67331 RepID=UPI0033AD42BB